MPDLDRCRALDVAARLRLQAALACDRDKRRLLHIADMHDNEHELVTGSRRAIAESKRAIATADWLLSR